MKRSRKPPPVQGSLRERAERRLGESRAPAATAAATEPELRKLLHELQVHQIELEMQNEELLRVQGDLEAARNEWESLFDFAPVGYCTLDGHGTILRLNLAGAALLGKPRGDLLKRRLLPHLAEPSRAPFREFLDGVLAERPAKPCDVVVAREGSEPATLVLAGTAEAGGSAARIAMTDVTQLRRHRDHLEELVAERTASLTRTNTELEEMDARNRRTVKEVSRSEERLRLAHQVGRSGAFEWDLRTNSVVLTPEIEELYGISGRAFGRDFRAAENLVLPEDLPLVQDVVRKGVDDRSGFHCEFRSVRADGERRWMEGIGRVFCDDAGLPVRIIGVNRDITERKESEEALRSSQRVLREKNEQLRALFESSTASMVLHDAKPSYRVLAHNRRYQEELCAEPWRSTGLVGLPLEEFLSPREAVRFSEIFRRAAETGLAQTFREFPYDDPGGSPTWFDWHVSPLLEGGTAVALAAVFTDVTMAVLSRRRVETEMFHVREANSELEAFSYTVSHDLRTPLRAINGFSSLLETHLGVALDGEGRRLIDSIKRNSMLMASLVDGLTEFTRIRSSDLNRTRLDMTGLAERALSGLLTDEQRRRVEVRLGPLPGVWADRDLVASALTHLLANAVKFSAGRPKPVVEVGFELGPDGTVYFVRDNGFGFDPKYAHRLFRVFQRLDGPPEQGRTGIGLALVKRIVERHGGWIRAEGTVNGGATFRFSLVPGPTGPEATAPPSR
jgi:PAS domain S-box-containing protein